MRFHLLRHLTWTAPLAFLMLALPLLAQDTRTVTEPQLPSSCAVLEARLLAPNGRLPAADEQRLDTQRIQAAIDGCAAGRAVELRASGPGNVFLAGPLRLRPGVTLRIDRGAVLFASRDPRLYDLSPGSCGVVNQHGHGCRPLISATNAPGSGIMGGGAIDGRGGETLLGEKLTWWDLAHIAKIRDLQQSCFRLLVVDRSNNFVLYGITLRNSPNFHVLVQRTNGFTAWGVRIHTPRTARNTDGIDPASSTNVSILHSWISDGDDDVAIKAGGAGPATHMTIADDHFYFGHGMSIGSETNGGVSRILVRNLTIDGADNGIRIKSDRSRGGLVHDVTYRNVCMRNVRNPILLTPLYTTHAGTLLPVYRDIALRDVHIVTPGRITLDGLDRAHPLSLIFDNVFADELLPSDVHAANANITLGPRLGNLEPAGSGVSLRHTPGSRPGAPLPCASRFVPFPADDSTPTSAENIPPVDRSLYVAADGTGEYVSLQTAVDAAPASGATIHIAPGVYRGTLTIDKPSIRLIGSGADPAQTILVDNKSAGTSGGTLRSATVNVRGDRFVAENITIENDFNRTHPQRAEGSQALALLVTGDRAVFRHVRILGNQDTLYVGHPKCSSGDAPCPPARQYFDHCYIAGNVDFIFGNGKAVFDHCEIHSTPHRGGFITAQARKDPAEDSGFVFRDCRLTAAPGVTGVYLGRPWRPYATVIFLNTTMGSFVAPGGWREWHPGETHSLATSDYAEYQSTGPGANPARREARSHQLTSSEIAPYATTTFLDGWNPNARP